MFYVARECLKRSSGLWDTLTGNHPCRWDIVPSVYGLITEMVIQLAIVLFYLTYLQRPALTNLERLLCTCLKLGFQSSLFSFPIRFHDKIILRFFLLKKRLWLMPLKIFCLPSENDLRRNCSHECACRTATAAGRGRLRKLYWVWILVNLLWQSASERVSVAFLGWEKRGRRAVEMYFKGFL